MDEAEFKIVASCKERGISWWLPLLRYQIERDRQRNEAEFRAYCERASHLNPDEHL